MYICTVLHKDSVTLAHDINSSLYVADQAMCCNFHKLDISVIYSRKLNL